MVKNREINGTVEIDLVNPTPELYKLHWYCFTAKHIIVVVGSYKLGWQETSGLQRYIVVAHTTGMK